jgi:hypothetical protein
MISGEREAVGAHAELVVAAALVAAVGLRLVALAFGFLAGLIAVALGPGLIAPAFRAVGAGPVPAGATTRLIAAFAPGTRLIAAFAPGTRLIAAFAPGTGLVATFAPGAGLVAAFAPGTGLIATLAPSAGLIAAFALRAGLITVPARLALFFGAKRWGCQRGAKRQQRCLFTQPLQDSFRRHGRCSLP